MYKRYLNKEEAENPLKSRHKFKTKGIMKKYSKPQLLAKNLPTGSYAAGCGMYADGHGCKEDCKRCEGAR